MWCSDLPRKKDKEQLERTFISEESEVVMANLRAWNYWGRTWRLQRKSPIDPHALQLMKARSLIYQKVYLKMALSLGGLKGKNVLDIGCGTSEYHMWLARDCERLIGVDISIEMLKLCREDMGKSIELVAADALHLPFREGVFDASMTFQALHHFPDWESALTEMMRTARQVSLYEPNGDSVLHRLMHLIRKTFRVEQRFKQTEDVYELVEFQAGGFSSARITRFFEGTGMSVKLFMFGIMPESLLKNFLRLSSRMLFLAFTLEDLMGKMPIIRNQLGDMLVIGCCSTNCEMKLGKACCSRTTGVRVVPMLVKQKRAA